MSPLCVSVGWSMKQKGLGLVRGDCCRIRMSQRQQTKYGPDGRMGKLGKEKKTPFHSGVFTQRWWSEFPGRFRLFTPHLGAACFCKLSSRSAGDKNHSEGKYRLKERNISPSKTVLWQIIKWQILHQTQPSFNRKRR